MQLNASACKIVQLVLCSGPSSTTGPPGSSLGLHQIGEAVAAERKIASWFVHAVQEAMDFQPAHDHAGVSIPRSSCHGINGCILPQPLQISQLCGNENRRGAFVVHVTTHAWHILWPSEGHRTPVKPQALRCPGHHLWVKPEFIEKCNLRIGEVKQFEVAGLRSDGEDHAIEGIDAVQRLEEDGLPSPPVKPASTMTGVVGDRPRAIASKMSWHNSAMLMRFCTKQLITKFSHAPPQAQGAAAAASSSSRRLRRE